MDHFKLKSIIKKSLNNKLREYARIRREPIKEFAQFRFELMNAIEKCGFNTLIEASNSDIFFEVAYDAWTNIDNELNLTDEKSKISVWNESVDFHVKDAILNLTSQCKHNIDIESTVEKITLKLKR